MPAAGEGPVAILAGAGALPLALARSLRARGRPVRLIAFRGFADRGVARQADDVADLLDVAGILARLAAWRPAVVAFAGAVHRPKPLAVMNAFSAYRNRDQIARLVASGDDRMLGSVVRMLEGEGFAVAGIDELAPELLAGSGVLGAVAPSAELAASLARGFALLEAVSPFDIGQAAVVCGARIAAIEGPEGTDGMLERVRGLWRTPRLRKLEPGGVLVKTAKASQDLRIDLPAIGPRTVARAAAARLTGIAVGAGRTLILDTAATIAEADRRGLFLVGVDAATRHA